MALPNDSINVTPGSGATVATQLVSSKEYQVVMVADVDGHVQGSNPVYRLIVPGSAVGANQVHCDLFNATGSGLRLQVLSARVVPDTDTAVAGTVAAEIALTRTTAVGTGGTAATLDSTSLTAPTIAELDTDNVALSANVTARSRPTAGATAGALLGLRYIFTEETSAAAQVAGTFGVEYVTPGTKIIVRENQGLRFVQGSVATVGTLTFEITFEAV